MDYKSYYIDRDEQLIGKGVSTYDRGDDQERYILLFFDGYELRELINVKLDGITKLLQYPEYSDVTKLRSLLGVLEEKDKLLDVISSHTTNDDGINVYIGREDSDDAMRDTTLIYKNVKVGGKQLAIGVIGPKRMNYSRVIGMINQLASGIDRIFSDEHLLDDGKKGKY